MNKTLVEDFESAHESLNIKQKRRLGQVITLSMSELEKIGQLRCLETDKKLAESLTDNDTLSRARETLIESMTPSEMLKKLQISAKRLGERSNNNTNFTQAAMPS